jgi:hypothetical protein
MGNISRKLEGKYFIRKGNQLVYIVMKTGPEIISH